MYIHMCMCMHMREGEVDWREGERMHHAHPLCMRDPRVRLTAVSPMIDHPCRQLVLGATLDVIVDSVCDNNKVSLVGFGTFSAKERPEREV